MTWYLKSLAIVIVGSTSPLLAVDEVKSTKVGSTAAIPVHVGDRVVSKVQDLHDDVSDLIAELKEATDNYGYANPKNAKATLSKLEESLRGISSRLDSKESDMKGDSAWQQLYNKDTYKTTVYESVRELGSILSTLAKDMEGGSKKTDKLPHWVANEVVDKVEDVRDSVAGLVGAIDRSGKSLSWYNWDDDQKKLADYKQRLDKMEEKLKRKEARSDHDWVAWFGADVYKVSVHDSLAELGDMVSAIGNSLAGRPMKKSSH